MLTLIFSFILTFCQNFSLTLFKDRNTCYLNFSQVMSKLATFHLFRPATDDCFVTWRRRLYDILFKTIVANGYLAISFVFILMSTTIERTYKQYCTKEGTFLMFLEALIAPWYKVTQYLRFGIMILYITKHNLAEKKSYVNFVSGPRSIWSTKYIHQ